MISKSARSFALALATMAFSGMVIAGEIYFSKNTNSQEVTTGDTVELALKQSGGTRVNFWTYDDNQTVAVFFNTECAVDGATNEWVDLQIKIDGAKVKPSSGDKALCTGKGTIVLQEWVSASANVAKVIPDAGKHKVKVTGQLRGWDLGDRFRVDDTSIIVIIGDDQPLLIK